MSDKWIRDTGLVLALLSLILGFKYGREFFLASAMLLSITLLVPRVLYPVAFLWLKLADLLNLIVPKIFFGLVFFLIVTPVGFLRRVIKGDTLLILGWRQAETAFTDRNHRFSKNDLEALY